MNKTLNVLQKNASTYITDMLYNKPGEEQPGFRGEVNTYYLFKDEMYFKKDRGIEISDIILFELEDSTQQSRSLITNKYTYQAFEADSVSILMRLVDFKIELKDRIKNLG